MVLLVFILLFTVPVLAVSGPVIYQGKYYYKVNSAEPTEDTGAKVCAKVGTEYIGFTALTTDVCKSFHPSAAVTQGVDGSNTGFYCNGPPQKGKCARETNTCDICPACNLNVDSTTVISDQYNEMYVECRASSLSPPPLATETLNPNIPLFKFQPSFLSGIYTSLRLTVLSNVWNIFSKDSLKKYMDEYLKDSYGCDFYQYPLGNIFYAACGSPGAADNFCKLKMNTAYAKSVYCGSDGIFDGLIICSAPCAPAVWAGSPTIPANCAYDAARKQVRGSDAMVNNCGPSTIPPAVSTTGIPNALIQNTPSPTITLLKPTITGTRTSATGAPNILTRETTLPVVTFPRPTTTIARTSATATTGTSSAETSPKLCPSACYLRTVSLGFGGNGYVNCEINPQIVHTPQDTCLGTETQISIDKNQQPVPCSCPLVDTVTTPCPSQCETGSAICFVNSPFIGKSQIPCDGRVYNTVNMHCTCILRDEQWKVGSAYQIY